MSGDYKAYNGIGKASVGSVYPIYASAGSGALSRVEPLITVEEFKSDYLIGVRLYDIINKRPITDSDLKRCLIRAMNNVEMSLNLNITPLQRTLKMPFDRLLFNAFGHMEIPVRPILSIDKMSIESADLTDQFIFPANLLETSNLHMGLITFGAISIMTPTGLVNSAGGPGGQSPLVLTSYMNVSWIPAFYRILVTTGFPENQIPVIVNEMIGVTAAIDMLSRIGVMFRATGTSLGQDGINQSISGPGPNIYLARIQQLQQRQDQIRDQLRSYYYNDIFVSNV